MNIKEITEIVALMNENDITEFVIEREDIKLCIKKGPQPGQGAAIVASAAVPTVLTAPVPAAATAPAPPQEAAEGRFIVSPMVGTFYSTPSPDSPPYVKVGQEVDENTVVCIIEAMKVMNEIKAERKGKILEVLVENGGAVEFGKRLFRIG